MSAIGDYLKGLRRSRGVSIRQLAMSARLSPSTLSRWEAGHTHPSTHELNALMDALKATETERRQAWELLDAPHAVLYLRGSADRAMHLPPMPLAGDLLRSLRVRRGWTLEQTATRLQISPATLSRWERSESWPSTEQMHHLCYVLHAHSEELLALGHGRYALRYDQKPFPSALPALQDMFRELERGELQVEPALCDLFYLSLEAHLRRLLQRGKPVLTLLITTYVRHARTLLNEARLIEARAPAQRALYLMSRCEQLDHQWLSAIHIIAKGAAETGHRFRPLQGVEVLRDWLPTAMRLSLAYEAWFLRDIAEYMSQTRARREAVETSKRALQKGVEVPGEGRNVFLSHALVLINVGCPAEALEILQSTPSILWRESRAPMQMVHEALTWARALHGAGQGTEAFQWLERVRQLMEGHNLWQISRRVDELCRPLE